MESVSQKIYKILDEAKPRASDSLRAKISLISDSSGRYVFHSGNVKGLVIPGVNSHAARKYEPSKWPIVLPCAQAELVIIDGEQVHAVRHAYADWSWRDPAFRIFSADRDGEPASGQVCGDSTPHSIRLTREGYLLAPPPPPPTALNDDSDHEAIAGAFTAIKRAFDTYAAAVQSKRSKIDTLQARIDKLTDLLPAVTAKIAKLERKADEVEKRAQKVGSGMRLIEDRAAELTRLRTAITAQEEGQENATAELADLKAELERVRADRVAIPEALAAIK